MTPDPTKDIEPAVDPIELVVYNLWYAMGELERARRADKEVLRAHLMNLRRVRDSLTQLLVDYSP